ncbi:hypothetical protein BKA67DRAFT_542223 [Truncatella angustata]|uniref:Uncharacterized protein n=1 Tax=Truncatella angustata TaxID=152316 RepID=A0A9P8UBA8_9PEZI|nr:uncharacterized protein BKA67DRAFT_542223 [Truncatella angustata]KAH6643259.1 hypothetical protein BKA67DRAFT_542223 [Truncatella angustata]
MPWFLLRLTYHIGAKLLRSVPESGSCGKKLFKRSHEVDASRKHFGKKATVSVACNIFLGHQILRCNAMDDFYGVRFALLQRRKKSSDAGRNIPPRRRTSARREGFGHPSGRGSCRGKKQVGSNKPVAEIEIHRDDRGIFYLFSHSRLEQERALALKGNASRVNGSISSDARP